MTLDSLTSGKAFPEPTSRLPPFLSRQVDYVRYCTRVIQLITQLHSYRQNYRQNPFIPTSLFFSASKSFNLREFWCYPFDISILVETSILHCISPCAGLEVIPGVRSLHSTSTDTSADFHRKLQRAPISSPLKLLCPLYFEKTLSY